MFRNQYDNDITTFSPQGRLHQIEYATEAVKQGAPSVGLCSKTHAVLVVLKRSHGELASYQKKIMGLDEHLGLAISGLTSDARVLCSFLRSQALGWNMKYESRVPVAEIAFAVADKAQESTQRYGGRPFGVGLLIAGFDATGPHLFEVSPSGNAVEAYGMAIGARGQSAKTYLERNLSAFADASLDELILHGLRALRDTLQQDGKLNGLNVSIAVVGADQPFKIIEGEEGLSGYLSRLSEPMVVE